jgi:hypothetical protein
MIGLNVLDRFYSLLINSPNNELMVRTLYTLSNIVNDSEFSANAVAEHPIVDKIIGLIASTNISIA